jgi:ribosomal protein S18 acetylase RimI-like enzyme
VNPSALRGAAPIPEIRLGRAADAAAAERIVGAAYAKYERLIGKPAGPVLDDYARRAAEGTLWVLVDETGPAAVLVLLPGEDHLLLDNIAVAPDRQGLHHGRRLMAFAESEAARRGHREIRLYTHAVMAENVAFYERLGYETTGRGRQAGYDRIFMRKII